MTMSEVAESIDVHETTVSRAIANKFVKTPHGTFPQNIFLLLGTPVRMVTLYPIPVLKKS